MVAEFVGRVYDHLGRPLLAYYWDFEGTWFVYDHVLYRWTAY